jgi:hypothetical protein
MKQPKSGAASQKQWEMYQKQQVMLSGTTSATKEKMMPQSKF